MGIEKIRRGLTGEDLGETEDGDGDTRRESRVETVRSWELSRLINKSLFASLSE